MGAGTMEYSLTMTGGSQFAAGLKAAASQATDLAGTLKGKLIGSVAAVGAALGAGMSVSWFAAGIKSAIDAGSELNILSQKTNETAANLLKIGRVAKDADLSLEAMGSMANRLQGALSGVNEMGESTSETFTALGLSTRKLSGMSFIQQLQAIGTGLEKIGRHEDKVKVLRNLFGKEGASLIPFFADVEKLGAPLSAGAALLAKNAEIFNRVGDALGRTGSVVKGFFYGVADRVVPVLLPLLDRFNAMDFSAAGQQVGNALKILLNAFSSGSLGQLFWGGLQTAAVNMVTLLGIGLGAAADGFGTLLENGVRRAVAVLADPGFWGQVAGGLALAGILDAKALVKTQQTINNLTAAGVGAAASGLGKDRSPVDKWRAKMNDEYNATQKGLDQGARNFIKWWEPNAVSNVKTKPLSDAERRGLASGKITEDALVKMRGAEIPLADVLSLALERSIQKLKTFEFVMPPDLKALLKQLEGGAAPTAKPKTLAQIGTDAAETSGRKPNVDQWQKIGFIVGGGGQTAATKAAEKTARHAEETVRQLQIIATKLGSTSAVSIATYA